MQLETALAFGVAHVRRAYFGLRGIPANCLRSRLLGGNECVCECRALPPAEIVPPLGLRVYGQATVARAEALECGVVHVQALSAGFGGARQRPKGRYWPERTPSNVYPERPLHVPCSCFGLCHGGLRSAYRHLSRDCRDMSVETFAENAARSSLSVFLHFGPGRTSVCPRHVAVMPMQGPMAGFWVTTLVPTY